MSFSALPNGRLAVTLKSSDGAAVVVHEQGAHVASWTTADGKEVMYMSPTAVYKDGTPLRGGVPVCFPQFSDMGPFNAHGVARNRKWSIVEVKEGLGVFKIEFRPGDEKLGDAVHADLFLTVTFNSSELKLSLKCCNLSSASLSFTTALHTYFSISSISNVNIHGLDNFNFADNLKKRQVFPPEQIRIIDKEVDRVYFSVTGPVMIADSVNSRNIVVSGSGLPDVVLWNPWIEKTQKFSDMPPDGYKDFVCVEHGVIQAPYSIPAGESWEGAQVIVVKPSPSKI